MKNIKRAVAQTNKKATEKLTEAQFYQAVKQSIKENQAQANNLVTEFRASNCAQTRNTSSTVVKAPVFTGKVVIEQAGSCKDLRARGISNINVKTNPWASKLDRDNDGIACESN